MVAAGIPIFNSMAAEPTLGNQIVMWDPDKKSSETISPQTFEEIDIDERYDLEEWIKQNPDILGERLFIVTSEFDKFEKTQKRLDLLALDADGKLVIVELKRDAAGTLADLQAIRYAASCSMLLPDHVIAMRAKYASVSIDFAKQQILEFLRRSGESADFSKLDNKPRIVIAAGGFDDQQITTSALWLRSCGVDISCVEITPYRLDGDQRIFLVPRVIIPLPEAATYMEGVETKEIEQSRSQASATQLEYKAKNQQILAFFNEIAPGIGPRQASPSRMMNITTGHPGISFAWWQWQHGKLEKMIDVAIHMENSSKERNRQLGEFLETRLGKITDAVGEQPVIEPWGESYWRLYVQRPREPWSDEIARWAAGTMLKLINVARPLIGEFYSNS